MWEVSGTANIWTLFIYLNAQQAYEDDNKTNRMCKLNTMVRNCDIKALI